MEGLEKEALEKHYITPLGSVGDSAISFSLEYKNKKKLKASEGREYLDKLLKALDRLGTTTLYVTDGEYFKLLTGERKTTGALGYVFDCVVKDYTHMKVIYGINHKQLFYDPSIQTKLDLSLDTLSDYIRGTHANPGNGIIHSAQYPRSTKHIAAFLDSLHAHPELSCDIETFSLKFWLAGIASIGFAWDKHNGGAFLCDHLWAGSYSVHAAQSDNIIVKDLLRKFFNEYKGKITYHNANFDIKVLIYELYMDDPLDNTGLINGLNTLSSSVDDTKIITYLATNTCAGNSLGLKENAHEFAGNYAKEDIKDVKLIQSDSLLEYNLVDCLSTNYVKEKNYPVMVRDMQEDIYRTIMLPSVTTLLQMELTGMPLAIERVIELKHDMSIDSQRLTSKLLKNPIIKEFECRLRAMACVEDNLLRERKPNSPAKPLSAYDYISFNPGSGPQLQQLLYDFLGYEVIDTTDTKQPATGAKTIKKLLHRSTCKEHTELFETLIELGGVNKILNTFIKAFIENSFCKADGIYYLHGSFNLGGTVSGRLSASQPNLQTIPSGSKYAKQIKECFIAPPGWLFGGADFASLEDRISALTTEDPEKLKVYTDGYDGHSLRAYTYFRHEMPDIVNTLESINTIADLYPKIRTKSKAPTFLLTYQGTHHGLMENCGFTREVALAIEKAYHEFYKVSDEWVAERLDQACIDGYVTTAFGLRVRTPILSQTILGNSATPYAAQAESRTAGNALGQGWCLLNNRAANEFMEIVRNSKYANDIKICAQIHDAIYLIWKNNLGVTKFVNDNLIKCMEWQEDPLIQHAEVKIGAELDIFYPNWSKGITINNNSSIEEIDKKCREGK
jgi:DNA polymerase-1